jgi:hypothetical protein
MKIFINKEYLKGCLLILFVSLGLSCEDDREMNYDKNAAINQQVIDPYLQVTTGFVSFQPGTPEYNIAFNVINGVKAINKVNVYTTFTDAGTGLPSNERLIGTYNVTDPYRNVITDNLTYDELRDGLTVNGQPLPEVDENVVPGSGWVYRFEGVDAAGNAVPLLGAINMVFSKYAGLYKVIDSHYFRIGVDNGDWNGEERFIGHVDDVTLSYNDWWGPFAWAGASFHFSVDPDTKAITIPILTESGLFSGNRAISCKTDKGTFKSVPCDGSNILVEDEATGKHKIYITYGYFTDGSGPREFYEVLEKIVN